MELTIKKEVNPNELNFYPLGIGGLYNLMLNGEYLCCVHDGQKDKVESIVSMARAYYNYANKETNDPDDLKGIL